MNDANNYESRLWELLKKENLADLSQFHRQGFFDEVPLYSRASDVRFLPDDERLANKILLRFALKFLNSIVAYEEHRTGYFAAITVSDISTGLLVPNLFVWCGPIRQLKGKLALDDPSTRFGKQVRKTVRELRLSESFDVLEETATTPESTRVFVAPARAPYRGFAALDDFRQVARVSG
jgi:hypothetical protein